MTRLKKILFGKSKGKVLVLSGGGFRGLYSVGILKGLEKLGLYNDIDAIFGVSIGAIIGALWSNGMLADEIYKNIINMSWNDFYLPDFFKKTGGILSNKNIKIMIQQYLPKKFSDLKKVFYVGAVDTNTAEYILFKDGSLQDVVLGSMSIPGVFPPVKYKNYSLVDGGVLNNFPVDLAKKLYPKHRIIGVNLSKFEKNQPINTMIDNISVSFEIMLMAELTKKMRHIDFLFHKKIPIPLLVLNKKKMKEAFDVGYQDCLKKFNK